MLSLFFDAAGQVILVALVLGAGLPALFALGVRSFTVAGSNATSGSDSHVPSAGRIPAPALRALGAICFAVVLLAVALGLTVIIATGFGQVVSFDSVIPTFTPKG